MRIRPVHGGAAALVAGLLLGMKAPAAPQTQPADACAATAQMQVYSNAAPVPGSSDVTGYELAVDAADPAKVKALLFDYQGSANDPGVELDGKLDGDRLTLAGYWKQSVTAWPSGKPKKLWRTAHADLTRSGNTLRGTLSINNEGTSHVELARVPQIWRCRQGAAH